MARKSTNNQTFSTANDASDVQTTVVEPASGEQPSVSNSNCGGVLRRAREALNLTVHDISSTLRLSDKQIEAMEADHFHLLPQPSILRGFIRNYAKAVKINADPIIAAFNARVPESAPQSFTVKSSTSRSVIGEHKPGFSPAIFLGLMLLFALIAGGFYYYTHHVKPLASKPIPATLDQSEELNVDVSANSVNADFALPSAQREAETDLTESTNATTTSNDTSQTSTASQSTEIVLPNTASKFTAKTIDTTPLTTPLATPQLQSDAVMSLAVKPDPPEVGQAPDPHKTLLITANEETWVNVVNGQGKQIYSKVLTKGQSDSIETTPPLKVTVGNAQHTVLQFNGQVIDLSAHTRDRVARLTLSE